MQNSISADSTAEVPTKETSAFEVTFEMTCNEAGTPTKGKGQTEELTKADNGEVIGD